MTTNMLAQGIDWNSLTHAGQSLSRLPQEWHMTAAWPLIVLLVVSVFIGLYGERLTRLLVLGAAVALGATLGRWLVPQMSLPFWPTVIFCGATAGTIAYVFYRWAFALALAAGTAIAVAAWSAGTAPDFPSLFSDVAALSDATAVPMPDAPASPDNYLAYIEAVGDRAAQALGTLAEKPEARKHLLLTMLAGGAAGLFAGLVLGRFAAILWTSVLAAAGMITAIVGLALWYQPSWRQILSDNRQYVLAVGAGLALLFLLRQLSRRRPTAVVVAAPGEVAREPDKS